MEQKDIKLLLEYLEHMLDDESEQAVSLDEEQLDVSSRVLAQRLRAVQKKMNHLQSQLKQKAYHDAGTGIYNRLYFDEYLEQLLEDRRPALIVYMDLDGLKKVNDQYGHGAGDAYIRRYVFTVQEQFRTTDVFARIGGDEFCLVLPNCPFELALSRLEIVRGRLEQGSSEAYFASFSYGIVTLDGTEDMTMDQILEIADEAMYKDKRRKKALRDKQ